MGKKLPEDLDYKQLQGFKFFDIGPVSAHFPPPPPWLPRSKIQVILSFSPQFGQYITATSLTRYRSSRCPSGVGATATLHSSRSCGWTSSKLVFGNIVLELHAAGAVVAVTGDYGEHFDEHGFRHSKRREGVTRNHPYNRLFHVYHQSHLHCSNLAGLCLYHPS